MVDHQRSAIQNHFQSVCERKAVIVGFCSDEFTDSTWNRNSFAAGSRRANKLVQPLAAAVTQAHLFKTLCRHGISLQVSHFPLSIQMRRCSYTTALPQGTADKDLSQRGNRCVGREAAATYTILPVQPGTGFHPIINGLLATVSKRASADKLWINVEHGSCGD
ncbi:hypothetical protein CC78DRAFT_587498 [Lojkania enalia]|uniref:Uncharacterized protein n=1 Tax=Lojkania enalia TaxID=147567 RepID=A0A9P4JZX6_9PLEO|nr:hypothetical protein CC78DRAFT_587498 [Didymosphaeria enalia]